MIAMAVQAVYFINKEDKSLLDSIVLSGASIAFTLNLVSVVLFINDKLN